MARRKKGRRLHGWLVVDKPKGLGSSQVVARVKRLLDAQKVGHAGTLDPMATGVLPLALGEATKTMPLVMDSRKAYRFRLKWGEATDTDDAEGHVIAQSEARPRREQLEALVLGLPGWISQRPPAYSAIKVAGARSYDLARQGHAPELAARDVWLESLDILDFDEVSASFALSCGKGFYVRALARDLAEALGTVAHVTELRRTQTCGFDESQAISLSFLEDLGQGEPRDAQLLPLSAALDDIPAIAVNDEEAARFRMGQAVPLVRRSLLTRIDDLQREASLLVTSRGVEVGLALFSKGQLKPTRVFNLN